MDRNTITGLVLIFLILMTFSYLNQPSQEELDKIQRKNDSIAALQKQKEIKSPAEIVPFEQGAPVFTEDSIALVNQFGDFAQAAIGTEKFFTLENNLVKVTISNKGGKIYSVELKNYKRFDGKPLILFEGEKNKFGINFFAHNKSIQTDQLYFKPSHEEAVTLVNGPEIPTGREGREKFNKSIQQESKSLTMRLDAGSDVFVEYQYTLKYNSYMVGFDIKTSGLKKIAGANTDYVNFLWAIEMPRQEKMSKFGENSHTTIFYKFFQDDVNNLSLSDSESKSLTTKVKWVGFKQQFFSSILIADQAFLSGEVKVTHHESDTTRLADMSADITIPLDAKGSEHFPASIYFGPNQFNTLNQYDLGLEEELQLGWTIIGWVNKYIVIPAFDFLNRYIGNFGLIILLLTIYIKLLVAPFTYKSHISQAKMRVLKPEIDEIQAKYPPEKKLEAQQAVMAFYKKAGVNPMGGCLPMLLQMPILIAMFYFFPISIELRQESFLWASDLSTYDSIFTLPFEIPFYGSHVSLFCLLMTVANLLYIKYNNEMSSAGTQQLPGMKTMMYLMPVMLLFVFNSYAAGLSYYYFLSLIFTFVQMFIFKKLVDEDKIHAQIKAKQKMPVTKSKFQMKLEEMAKQQAQNKKR